MLKELMIANPKPSIIILSFLITLSMTLVTKYFTNQNRMKELKDLQKSLQKKLKDNKDNPNVIKEIQTQIMGTSMELMKHSFKPLLFTFLPLIIFFWWIRGIYVDTLLAKSWIWWYIGAGIMSSIILRKMLKVV